MGRIIGFVLLFLVVAGGVIIFRILNAAGYFNEVTPHFGGKCQSVEGVVGAEDIELDRETGLLFISSQDRRPSVDKSYKPGALYLAHIDQPEIPPQPLAVGDKVPVLHPHGISLFSSVAPSSGLAMQPQLRTRKTTLAVVNHTDEGDEVLFFDVTTASPEPTRTPGGVPQMTAPITTLTFHHKVKDPLMHSLNDISLVSHEAFYATNDHGSQTAFGKFLETWLLLPRANVVFYDGSAAKIAATGFNYANGINRNADASEIYVAEATGRALQTFRRDMTTGMLDHIHTLFLGVGPDNLDVDSDGAIWIGAHPRLLDFLAHAEDETKKSPSAVLKVTPSGDDTKFETIYVNMGEELSGSSVAIAHKGRLVIGPVFDPKFLNCTLN